MKLAMHVHATTMKLVIDMALIQFNKGMLEGLAPCVEAGTIRESLGPRSLTAFAQHGKDRLDKSRKSRKHAEKGK